MKKLTHLLILISLFVMSSLSLLSHSAEQPWFNPMNAVINNDFGDKPQDAVKKKSATDNQDLAKQNKTFRKKPCEYYVANGWCPYFDMCNFRKLKLSFFGEKQLGRLI